MAMTHTAKVEIEARPSAEIRRARVFTGVDSRRSKRSLAARNSAKQLRSPFAGANGDVTLTPAHFNRNACCLNHARAGKEICVSLRSHLIKQRCDGWLLGVALGVWTPGLLPHDPLEECESLRLVGLGGEQIWPGLDPGDNQLE